ncbi:MAG: hypothetical protein IJ416_08105 [Ruminiclostridium sp.]|nr:hypothetical protein [Ruminiclostridium sp.]
MALTNVVTAGDYKGAIMYKNNKKGLYINPPLGLGKKPFINKTTVASYEVINQESTKSVASGVARGIVGGALLGGVGAIAGAASAKNKGNYTVSIIFKDGKKCLCELDDFMYKRLVEILY